jgi:hypothetical protein
MNLVFARVEARVCLPIAALGAWPVVILVLSRVRYRCWSGETATPSEFPSVIPSASQAAVELFSKYAKLVCEPVDHAV